MTKRNVFYNWPFFSVPGFVIPIGSGTLDSPEHAAGYYTGCPAQPGRIPYKQTPPVN